MLDEVPNVADHLCISGHETAKVFGDVTSVIRIAIVVIHCSRPRTRIHSEYPFRSQWLRYDATFDGHGFQLLLAIVSHNVVGGLYNLSPPDSLHPAGL